MSAYSNEVDNRNANQIMNVPSHSKELDQRPADYGATALRAITGLLPIVGPLFSELAGVVVPNQRMERIARFAAELDRRLRVLEAADRITGRLGNEEFADLLEEGIRQAVRSLSDERRQYLAALVVNGLTTEDIEYSESRHLLRMLNDLSDVEIVWLRSYWVRSEEFFQRHENVLAAPQVSLASPRKEQDRATRKTALQDSYKEHLCWLGLLERRYRVDIRSRAPKFDRDGAQELAGYDITPLGRLLLRQIGLEEL
ncbi:MAG: hypothetical protein OXK77_04065 [Gemmatimonadota bacterium]|nr:hypothetical protein [Gemmatimonadota bacterium]MDE2865447.1 hypothetical protein [Gemmatimonadota bacterium]